MCYGNPNNPKRALLGWVEGLVNYLTTEYGDWFDKDKFFKAIFDSGVLKMIERQDKLPENCFDITISTNSYGKEFVTKVCQQKGVTKFKQYNECVEYIQCIGIKTEAELFNWAS